MPLLFQPAPALPRRIFSDEFIDFVAQCLKKNTTERASHTTLMQDAFFKRHEQLSESAEFSQWIQSVIGQEGEGQCSMSCQ